jgi:hypothetical protein
VKERPVPEATAAVAYRVLTDGRLVEGSPPAGLYVEGTVIRGRFVARGDVQGAGELGREGHPGWVELSTGRFTPAETAVAPTPPYVEGTLTDAGFVPGSRVVVYFP